MLNLIFFLFFVMPFSFGTEIELQSRYPGIPKSAVLRDRSGKWTLETNHSAIIPRAHGIGIFVSSSPVGPNEKAKVSEEARKLKVREDLLKDLPDDHSHGNYLRLNNHPPVGLDEKFGSDLGQLFDEILNREWVPQQAIMVSQGKLQFWESGKLRRTWLPSQLAECRWLSDLWSCDFEQGRIEIKAVK